MLRLLPLLLFALAVPAQAQIGIVAYGGYDTGASTAIAGVGGEFGLPIDAPIALAIRATAEYVAPTTVVIEARDFNREVRQAHLDLLGAFGAGTVTPYAGLGVAFASEKLDTADDDTVEGDQDRTSTRIGANVIAGASVALGPVAPFAQARLTLSEETAVTVMGGLTVGF